MSETRLTKTLSCTLLSSVIEREIIPRLFDGHPDASADADTIGGHHQGVPQDDERPCGAAAALAVDPDEMVRLILAGHGTPRLLDPLLRLLDQGIGLSRIYLDILTPVARRIGELWQQDRCSMLEVTLSLSRLHCILLEIGRHNGGMPAQVFGKPRIFLAPVPGEQHTFGLLMVQEFFLQAGWGLDSRYDASLPTIIKHISTKKFDIVGFSISGPDLFETLQNLIHLVRKHSLHRNLSIIVGGGLFKDQPEFASRVSGATVVGEGVNAVEAAENLIYTDDRRRVARQPV